MLRLLDVVASRAPGECACADRVGVLELEMAKARALNLEARVSALEARLAQQ